MEIAAKVMNRTYLKTALVTESIAGSDKYVRLVEPFIFYSSVLRREVIVPKNMIFDLESIPLLRGTCPEAGCAHDYLCRKDSNPTVTKRVAAQVYFELMDHIYSLDDTKKISGLLDKIGDGFKKWAKWAAVYLAPGYFHKHSVFASYREITK